MTTVAIWYLAMQVFALAALPLAFRVCTCLYDRGYGMSKALGLVLVTYIAWLLGHTTLATSGGAVSFRIVSLALVLVGFISVVSLLLNLRELGIFLRQRWRILLLQELILVVAFGAMLTLRGFVPHISYHTTNIGVSGFIDHAAEKFTDFAVLNSLLTSPSFPPHDAWVAGYQLNYYYFGHLMWACMIKFASVRPEIGYNLALGSLFALVCTQAFSLGYNLTRRARWGLLTMFLVALSSNLDGFLQLIGLLKNLLVDRFADGAWYYMSPWYRNYDFWRSSRAIENTITEFPAFSFVLGDLHAHLSSLVIHLCGLILAVQIWRNATRYCSLFRYEWHNWDELFLAALLAGAMSAANSWDAITFAVVLTAVLWASRMGRRDPFAYIPASHGLAERLAGGLASVFVAALVIALGVMGLFWLFISRFKSPLPKPGPDSTLPPGSEAAPSQFPVIPVPPELRTHPFEFFTHWSLFLVPVFLLLLGLVFRYYLPRLKRTPVLPGSEGGGPYQRFWALFFVGVAVACVLVPLWKGWVAIAMALLAAVSFAVLLFHRLTPVYRLVAGLLFTFSLLACFCELYCLDDIFSGDIERINTVFKIYYGLWPLAAIMAVLALQRIVRYAPAKVRRNRAWWCIALVVILGIAYPVLAPLQRIAASSRIGYFRVPEGTRYAVAAPPIYREDARAKSITEALDGMRYLKYLHPDDYYAIHWIRQNLPPDAVLLEAVGQLIENQRAGQRIRTAQYTYSGRISTMTGRPGFGGWLYHSYAWRGEGFVAERDRRIAMGTEIYEADSPQAMLDLLLDEKIEYVVVGDHERQQYVHLNEAALSQISKLVYVHGQTHVYKVDPSAELSMPPPPPPQFPDDEEATTETLPRVNLPWDTPTTPSLDVTDEVSTALFEAATTAPLVELTPAPPDPDTTASDVLELPDQDARPTISEEMTSPSLDTVSTEDPATTAAPMVMDSPTTQLQEEEPVP